MFLLSYRQIIKYRMEERQIIKVEVLNEIHLLSRQDFINFHPIITSSHFKNTRIPQGFLDKSRVTALNIILYYIISIHKNFRVFPEDSLGNQYKELCTKEISDYYIRNKFFIEEYEFALLTSKALKMKVEECAHIIYYLIYGRFASHPYINFLCGKNNHNSHKSFKKGKQFVENLRSIQKKTIKVQKNQNQFEVNTFREDLKTTLKSDQTRLIGKQDKIFDSGKIREQVGQNKNILSTERKTLSRACSSKTFIPSRIKNGQKSFIFENLSNQRKTCQTFRKSSRKESMRKQKFNEFFDINEFKLKTKLKKSQWTQGQNKQNQIKNVYGLPNCDSQRRDLINDENLREISTGIKMKNAALDKIRGDCFARNYKCNFDKPSTETLQETLLKLSQFTKDTSKGFPMMCRRRKEYSEGKDKEKCSQKRLKINLTSIEDEDNKDYTIVKHFRFEEHVTTMQGQDDQGEDIQTVNILRNDDLHKKKQNQEQNNFQYFSHTSTGFKTINFKHNLQKYKKDLKRFNQTQALDKMNHAY